MGTKVKATKDFGSKIRQGDNYGKEVLPSIDDDSAGHDLISSGATPDFRGRTFDALKDAEAEASTWVSATPSEAAMEPWRALRDLNRSRSEVELITSALRVHEAMAANKAEEIFMRSVRGERAKVDELRHELSISELQTQVSPPHPAATGQMPAMSG